MPNTIFAIDPGLNGAYAVWGEDGKIQEVGDLPRFSKHLNGAMLAKIIAVANPLFCVIEQVGARPGQGVSSTFNFGCAYGVCIGTFMALDMPFDTVTPGTWKREMGIGKDKERARQKAVQLHPEAAEFLGRKLDHNRAEAILLAHYWSRRKMPVEEV